MKRLCLLLILAGVLAFHSAGQIGGTTDTTMTITPGKVGIGTTAPSHTLTIRNDSSQNMLRLIGPLGVWNHGARFNFGDANYVYIEEDEDDHLHIHSLARTSITGGNVGIGTLVPGEKLEVAGTIYASQGGLRFPDSTLQTTAATTGTFWGLKGNAATNPDSHFIGTTDSTALEIRVNNRRGLRIVPTSNTPYGTDPNYIFGKSSSIDSISSDCIVSGYANSITNSAGAVILGGAQNHIDSATYSNIISGDENEINKMLIGSTLYEGGYGYQTADLSTICNGFRNKIEASYGFIGGGRENTLFTDTVFVPGYWLIVGGDTIQYVDGYYSNFGLCSGITAGIGNRNSGQLSMIGGGGGNGIIAGEFNFIGGGYKNVIDWLTGGAVIGGGELNLIDSSAHGSVIAGGIDNIIKGNEIGEWNASVIGGGYNNHIYAILGTIGGGGSFYPDTLSHNRIYADYGTIGGGSGNAIDGQGGTIGGGSYNQISDEYGAIGGGYENDAGNLGAICGGGYNVVYGRYGSIGGGSTNVVGGEYATIPGGKDNEANGKYSFAAGRGAKAGHTGCFVWADSTDSEFVTTDHNQFLIYASGNVGIMTNNPSQKLHVDKGNMLVSGEGSYNAPGEEGILYLGSIHQYVKAVYGTGLQFGAFAAPNAITLKEISGYVGIGNTAPAHPLHMGSGAHCTSSGVWTDASDRSKKYHITDIDYGLQDIMDMQPRSFHYKADDSEGIGFIAQEMEVIIPQVVSGQEGDKGIAYGILAAVLVKGIQEQQTVIEAQESKIADQEREISRVSHDLKKLQARIEKMEAVLGAM